MGKKNLENQQRLDWYENAIEYATDAATKTDEGFLIARAPLTSIGVFTYKNADGTPRRELRLPEEVFSEESLATLKMKPLTLLHPDEAVTPENVEKLQVGSIGSDIYTDSFRVYGSLAVTKTDGIKAVEENTARSLSCGYKCDIEWTSGTWMGVRYDCIQRKIRYNHVALVPVPRAGDGTEIRMDGYGVGELPEEDFNKHEDDMDYKTIHLDGADYKAEPQVIAALDKAVERADAAEKELAQVRSDMKAGSEKLSAVEAERDSFKERLDAMEKEIPGKVESAVAARLDILGKATAAGVEVRNDMATADIMKAVIMKKFPSASLEGKDESYIQSRFDCACELVAADAENKSRQDAAETLNNTHTAQDVLAEAEKGYNSRMDSAWQDNK